MPVFPLLLYSVLNFFRIDTAKSASPVLYKYKTKKVKGEIIIVCEVTNTIFVYQPQKTSNFNLMTIGSEQNVKKQMFGEKLDASNDTQ